jgi:hypothetical protein
MMAKTKDISQQNHLSEEKVYDSSDNEDNEASDTAPSPSSKSKKLPLRETKRTKLSGKFPAVPSDTTSEDDGESTESEEDDDDNEDEDDRTESQESSSESSKRKSPPATAEQPSRKKTKATPTATSTVQIASKSFKAPHGYEPLILSASDFASDSASLFENLQGKQIWHISAPDTVSIDAIKELDIQAALQGQPILTKDGVDYNMHPALVSSDVLLLPQGTNSTYEQSELKISRSFHLRQMGSKGKHQTKDHEETPLIFTATEEGQGRIPRKQPGGLKMRYTPFGAPPAPRNHDDDEDEDEDVEMSTETATFQVPDEIVGERSSGKQAANEEAGAMQRGEKRVKKSKEKDRVSGSNEKKQKKKRMIVDEDVS